MFAATFPGQGSQSVGMLSDLSMACAQVRGTFEEASGALGYDLWKLVREGPERSLNATEQTQPAMLAAGVAAWRCWTARGGPRPGVAAGHSLGEYSALVAFGAFEFADAIRTVAARGRFMQEAVPEGEGGIAAIIGLHDDAVVRAVRRHPRDGGARSRVPRSTSTHPGQVAIAGAKRAIDTAIGEARKAGAKRAIRLPMSVPVHCPADGARDGDGWRRRWLPSRIGPPSVPILHNVDVASRSDEASIRNALSAQLASPVRWRQTVIAMRDRGASTMLEFGPGRVLTGLARRIDRGNRGIVRARLEIARRRTAQGHRRRTRMRDLDGEVAVVTGASRGIGAAIARTLSGRGARVVGTATTEDGARRVEHMLAGAPCPGTGLVLDVAEAASVDTGFASLAGRGPRAGNPRQQRGDHP